MGNNLKMHVDFWQQVWIFLLFKRFIKLINLQKLSSITSQFSQCERGIKKLKTFIESTKLEHNIDPEWLDLDSNKLIKVTKKVMIPTFRYPNVSLFSNFCSSSTVDFYSSILLAN
jgi:hypothetical protein